MDIYFRLKTFPNLPGIIIPQITPPYRLGDYSRHDYGLFRALYMRHNVHRHGSSVCSLRAPHRTTGLSYKQDARYRRVSTSVFLYHDSYLIVV